MDVHLPLSQITLIVMISCFAFGILSGMGISYLMLRPGKKNKKLLLQINSLEKEQQGYRKKVSQHFMTTAELINQLTESYRNVHQHLTSSAYDLCDNEKTQYQLQDAWHKTNILNSENLSDTKTKSAINPPIDYVVKRQH